jgi:tetratricopeptide (TPR) repeat protein
MRQILFTLTILLTFLQAKPIYAQRPDPADADEHYRHQNFVDALIVYKKLLKAEPSNPLYNFRAGVSILLTDRDKKEAVNYLEIAAKNNADPEAYYYLGLAYHYNLQFDEAREAFNKYKQQGKGNHQDEVDRRIEMVNNAEKLVPAPINVTFTNVGPNINTEYPDYYPFITKDESMMVWTARRNDVVGRTREFDGYYSSDIYMSTVENGEWTPAKNLKTLVNSTYDEQAVGLSADGTQLFIYFDDIKNVGDIYISYYSKGKFRKKEKFSEAVNSKGFESSATISPDGNTLLFASRRPGGFGGKDIYITRKLPTGEWAEPQNIGDVVNTPYDEDFPNLFFDGKTMYFASEGHNSIGGFDIFKTVWDPETNTWSKPENIGYPINTPENNMTISFTEDARHAYISCWRKDSYGFLDIYRVTFEDLGDNQTVLKGQIFEDSLSTTPITDAFISVTDNRTQEEIGQYMPNNKTGKYVIILKPGSYEIMIEANGKTVVRNIIVKGLSDFVPFIDQNFYLKP